MTIMKATNTEKEYDVSEATLNKVGNLKYLKLHDVLEQKSGYNFVFSHKFMVDKEMKTGYKTIWQDKDQYELQSAMREATINAIKKVGTDIFKKTSMFLSNK